MKRRSFSLLAAGSFLACLLYLLGPFTWFGAALLPSAPSRSVTARSLLVDLSVLPQGWQIWEGPFTLPRELDFDSMENAGVHFGRGGNPEIATHDVLRFRNTLAASSKLSNIRYVEYSGPSHLEGWASPAGWSYQSPVADDFQFACAPVDRIMGDPSFTGTNRCTAVARYGEYVSIFSAPVSDKFMSLGDIEPILRDIDRRMASYIKQRPE